MVDGSETREPVDGTVLAFAQWVSENKSRNTQTFQQLLAEMGVIRNGVSATSTDLIDFKRNNASVQSQIQNEMRDLREKLSDAFTEIAAVKKSKSHFEQETASEIQSLNEQLQYKSVEMESLKKAHSQSLQSLQSQLIALGQELNEVRVKGDETSRVFNISNEQNLSKTAELEMSSNTAHSELKRMRADHDQAIANLASNMNKWNDAIRDLSREFHEFQKLMNNSQVKLQNSVFEALQQNGGGQPQQQQQYGMKRGTTPMQQMGNMGIPNMGNMGMGMQPASMGMAMNA